MSARTMVMYRRNSRCAGIHQSTYNIRHTALHLRVGTLNGIQRHGSVTASVHGRNRATAHAYAVTVAAKHHYPHPRLNRGFDGTVGGHIPHSTGHHNHLVVAANTVALRFLHRQHRPANQRLAEFIAEVRGPVRGTYQQLIRTVQCSLAVIHRCHIYSRTGKGNTATASAQAVANLASAACRSPCEGLHGRREVVRLRLKRPHHLALVKSILRRPLATLGRKLLHRAPVHHGGIVTVCREHLPRRCRSSCADKIKEALRLCFAVHHEPTVENLVAAVLAVYLREPVHLTLCELASQALQVAHLILAKRQSAATAVLPDVAHQGALSRRDGNVAFQVSKVP